MEHEFVGASRAGAYKAGASKAGAGDGVQFLVKDGSFLQNLLLKTGDALQITRAEGKTIGPRRIFDLDLELTDDKPVELPHCEGVSFHIGATTKGRKGRIPAVNMRLVHNQETDSTVATLQGDLSLLLPQVGLIPVGTVPSDFTSTSRPVFRLSPDAAGLLGARSRFHVPLGQSQLVVDDLRDHLRVSPSVDLHGRIYRIGNTGVLVGFETMTFSCEGAKPRLDFNGGRIWQVKDAQ